MEVRFQAVSGRDGPCRPPPLIGPLLMLVQAAFEEMSGPAGARV